MRRLPRDRLARTRRSPRLVIGARTPIEIREALIKAVREDIHSGFHVLLERNQREALNNLAVEADTTASEVVRLLVKAATTLGLTGMRSFIDAANRAEKDNLPQGFDKAER